MDKGDTADGVTPIAASVAYIDVTFLFAMLSRPRSIIQHEYIKTDKDEDFLEPVSSELFATVSVGLELNELLFRA